VQIANPLYDVAFRYLMEDHESAKILLSALLGQTVVALRPAPTEYSFALEKQNFTVYRMDFAATVRMDDGRHRQVILEIQKAKLGGDILRFRRYLGEQYRNKALVSEDEKGKKVPLPIISIYFLGYAIADAPYPVLLLKRRCVDATSGQALETLPPFFEGVTHDSMAVQVSLLKEPYQGRLQQLLSIFDQHRATENGHILNVDAEAYPEEGAALIRRLGRAASEPEVRKTMDVEDEFLADLEALERTVAEKDQALEEKDKALEEKDKALEEKDKALEEKDKVLRHQQKLIEELQRKLGVDT